MARVMNVLAVAAGVGTVAVLASALAGPVGPRHLLGVGVLAGLAALGYFAGYYWLRRRRAGR